MHQELNPLRLVLCAAHFIDTVFCSWNFNSINVIDVVVGNDINNIITKLNAHDVQQPGLGGQRTTQV